MLSKAEIHTLLKAPKYLKHRLILDRLYGSVLRSYQLFTLRFCDVDLNRQTVFVKKQKGKLDRYLPLSKHLKFI
ncbi:tyrosine-type recombinase/integrase [Leeuwenhoekiella marinoflava]|uniref:tyrosine-type recombinase/integrase n=1 Tax=Leeuwenhoekiella marinoflava TaxID=988 RepID=UPI0009338887|nr:tyrosine-type recombinase/integrase [Leeuwenhoekiella marinoflava]